MQEGAQTCASWWRQTLRPKRVRFLAMDASIVDCVCLPKKKLNFLTLYAPSLRVFVKKKERKSAINKFRFCIDMSQRSTAQHCHIYTPFCTIRKSHVTWNFAVPVPHSEEIRRCMLLFLCTLVTTSTPLYLLYLFILFDLHRPVASKRLGIKGGKR